MKRVEAESLDTSVVITEVIGAVSPEKQKLQKEDVVVSSAGKTGVQATVPVESVTNGSATQQQPLHTDVSLQKHAEDHLVKSQLGKSPIFPCRESWKKN